MEEQNGLERLASHRIQGVLPKKYHMEYRSGSESLVEEQSLKEVEEMIDVPESLQPDNMSRKLEQIYVRKKQRQRRLAVCGICVIILIIAVIVFLIVRGL